MVGSEVPIRERHILFVTPTTDNIAFEFAVEKGEGLVFARKQNGTSL